MITEHGIIQNRPIVDDFTQTTLKGEKMNRRSLIKSLLPTMAGILLFKNAYGAYEPYTYKGKKLIIVPTDILNDMCKKREIYIPKFQSNKSIMDDMKMFVDMSEGHMNELGQEVYGCVHKDGSYSVASFSNLPCRTYSIKL